MIKYIKGDILDVTDGIIVQQVNCFGVMGAGLAKQIRDKWPKVYNHYLDKVSYAPRSKDLLGMTCWSKIDSNLSVASIFGQYDYGHSGTYTIYPALFKGLDFVFGISESDKLPIYIPKGLGCGLAGGNWIFVEDYIKGLDYMSDFKLDIVIVEKEDIFI